MLRARMDVNSALLFGQTSAFRVKLELLTCCIYWKRANRYDPLNTEIIFLTTDRCFLSPETDNLPSPSLYHLLCGCDILPLGGFSRFAMINKIIVVLSLQSAIFSYSWTVIWWDGTVRCFFLFPQTCKVVLIFVSAPCIRFNLYLFAHVT